MAELLADESPDGLQARRMSVEEDQPFYEPNTPAHHLYFIHGGQVRVFQMGRDNSARLLEILGPGDWFGIPSLARADVYHSRAVAATRGAVSEISADRLRALLPQRTEVAQELIEQLAAKLQAAREDAANLVFEDTNQRLIKTLLQFSRSAAARRLEAKEGTAGGVELRITHQQLAQAVGAARETVSLALTQLRQQNLLRTGRNRLSFNPDALAKFSSREGLTPTEA